MGQELARLRVRLLRDVVHLWAQAGKAHRQIVLGAMTGAVGAFASGLAAALVALDEGTTEDGFERGQLAQERLAAFSQGGSGLFRYFHRTTLTTGLTVTSGISFVNAFLQVFSGEEGRGRSASNNVTSSKRQSAASRWGG